MRYELAFIGAGNMAEAIARGLISTNALAPSAMIAADVSDARRTLFQHELRIHSVADPVEAAKDSAAILLAVKPQHMAEALNGIGSVINDQTLVISIAAGINTQFIETNLGPAMKWKVVRTMPNTPMLVGLGAVGIAPGTHATPADVAAAARFFAPAAQVVDVTEDKLDAVTALSGSGPAYLFYLLEHMIAAGMSLGLTQEQSERLAKQTVLGAASMAKASQDTPAALRRKVTSPNGTTQAAIESMDASNVGENIEKAVAAACARSIQLGKK